MCPPGAIRVFIESDSRTPRDPALDQVSAHEFELGLRFLIPRQLRRIHEKEFAKGGFSAPLNYYKVAISAEELEDSKRASHSSFARNHVH